MTTLAGVLAAGVAAPPTGRAAVPPTPRSPADFVGTWQGTLSFGQTRVRLVFHVREASDGALAGMLDSPDQGVTGIPMETVTVSGDSIRFDIGAIRAVYAGRLTGEREAIAGEWRQGGVIAPLELTKVEGAPAIQRPQEPEPPYPYREEAVEVEVPGDGVTLAGTLTLPSGDDLAPAVVLVSGSGVQDRDEAIAGHRPFLVLADRLSREGVAVLRMDDRGIGGSTGSTLTSTLDDRVDDVLAAVDFLSDRPEVDPERIGLLGHSEGGFVIPVAAVRAPEDVAFLVFLAGPAQGTRALLLSQQRALLGARGAGEATIAAVLALYEGVFEILDETPDSAVARTRLEGLGDELVAELPDAQGRALEAYFAARSDAARASSIRAANTVWFRDLISFDPAPSLERVEQPILALFGGHDLQVPADENAAALRRLLDVDGRADRTVRVLPGLNHLFQPSRTGLPAEYATIETTIAPSALDLIGDWIQRRVVRRRVAEPSRRRRIKDEPTVDNETVNESGRAR